MWECIVAVAPILANAATIIGLVFVVLQLRTAARSARVQAWAFLLDNSNKRWTHYISAKDAAEKRFALGELLNFMEIMAGDINRDRLPYAIVEQVSPYFVGVIDLMAREQTIREGVNSMVSKANTFSELRGLALRHRTEFTAYGDVEQMLHPSVQ